MKKGNNLVIPFFAWEINKILKILKIVPYSKYFPSKILIHKYEHFYIYK